MAGSAPAVFTVPFTGFEVPVEVVVLGVITGLIYGLLGIGLTLVYKASRVINFAHGDIGALTVGTMAFLVVVWDVPYLIALIAALAGAVVLGGLLEFLVIRRLARAPRLVVLVATIGASQVLLGLTFLIPRDDFRSAAFPTPFTASVTIGNLRLNAGELMILALVPLITAGLALFLRRSRIGLAARASAENLEAARLAGARARRVSLTIWMIAALLSTASAVLLGPTRPPAAFQTLGPSLMVKALAAGVIGGLSSLPQVAAGGVAIGVVEVLVAWNYPTAGAVEVVLLGLTILSMFLRRDLGRAARGTEESSWSLGGALRALEPRLARHPRVRAVRTAALAAVLAAAVLLPALPIGSGRRVLLSSIALFALMGLSITIVTGFAGQVSLGQGAFVALGAAVGGRLFQLGHPEWAGIIYATATGGALALLVGLPALRLRGLFLAVTTLAFAVAAENWVPRQDWLVAVEGGSTSLELPRQEWLGIDFHSELHYYWLCLGLFVVVAAVVARLRRTGTGRALMAVRDNEAAAATLSISPRRAKLTAFVLSGMIASLAGYFYGGLLVGFSEVDLFAPAESLALVAMVIFGGVTSVTGCILGALWIRGIPYIFGSNAGILSSGLGVLVVLQMVPGGLASLALVVRDRVAGWITGEPVGRVAVGAEATTVVRQPLRPAPAADGDHDGALPIVGSDIVVRFGGLVAVDGVSIEAHRGEIVGLIGPNGAGKTTLFDVLSGQRRATSGRVLLAGEDVTHLRPEQRAVAGLGRSFQEARLFPELTLIDAFKLALEADEPAETVPSLLGLPASRLSEGRKDRRAGELVELLGLTPFAYRDCAELSTGTRRFAELGLMLAMGSRVVLLDEPTAGIAQREVEAFIPVVREMRDHLDATMVVIDHDIPMISNLVDRLYVMAAGQLIAEGPPEHVRADPTVIAAYLGTEERAIRRSGRLEGAAR